MTKVVLTGDIMALSKNPEVTIEVVTSLYYGPQRASRLVDMVQENLDVSEPTVYGVLQDLAERGFVEKVVRSRRNVTYKLTHKGRDLIQREHFDAIGDIMSLIKSAKRKRELLIELLIEDIMDGIPEDWSDERKAALRRSMDDEVDLLKRRMVMLSDLANTD
jgi:DNA-binding PadR family transcriptional regulator